MTSIASKLTSKNQPSIAGAGAGAGAGAATETVTTSTSNNVADTRYTFDSDKLEELRKKSPWKDDAKWFTDVSVSPTAIVKMVRKLPCNNLTIFACTRSHC